MKWHFLSLKNSEENKDFLRATLHIQWLEGDHLDKRKYFLSKTLQTWASTLKKPSRDEITCDVFNVSEDGTEVVVSIKPPPGAE